MKQGAMDKRDGVMGECNRPQVGAVKELDLDMGKGGHQGILNGASVMLCWVQFNITKCIAKPRG